MSVDTQAFAAEVRAEMARTSRTRTQLAEVLNHNLFTTARLFRGNTPYTAWEQHVISLWLGVPLTDLMARAEHNLAPKEAA